MLKNLSYVLFSQLVVIILGLIRSFSLPLYLGVDDFGYWQLYLLYLSTLTLFSLGYCDGIYLKYGNYNAESLPTKLLRGGGVLYFLQLIILSLVVLAYIGVSQPVNAVTLIYIVPNILLTCLVSYVTIILQITNQFSQFAKYLVLDKIIFLLLFFVFALLGSINVHTVISMDLCSRFFLFLIMIYRYYELFFGATSTVKRSLKLYFSNLKSGSKLLVGNFIGMLLLLAGRFFVEKNYSLYDFSIYSFGVTLTNLMLIAIGAIGVVLYPALKRMNQSEHPLVYQSVSEILTAVYVLGFASYYILVLIVDRLLPDFVGVIDYLNLFLVVCFFQSKLQILINNYYKAFRLESVMLYANINAVIGTLFFIFVAHILFSSPHAILLATSIAMLLRFVISDFYFRKKLRLSYEYIFYDVFIALFFIFVTEFIDFKLSYYIYVIFLVLYIGFTIGRNRINVKYVVRR